MRGQHGGMLKKSQNILMIRKDVICKLPIERIKRRKTKWQSEKKSQTAWSTGFSEPIRNSFGEKQNTLCHKLPFKSARTPMLAAKAGWRVKAYNMQHIKYNIHNLVNREQKTFLKRRGGERERKKGNRGDQSGGISNGPSPKWGPGNVFFYESRSVS